MKYFDTFTGIGGFSIPLEELGFECAGFSEIDKYAIQIYKNHFPNHTNYGDITKIDATSIPDFDILVGGFPCQSFSIAGKRGGFEDTRGTLFFDLARILRAKRPSYFIFENVKGLLNHENGRTYGVIISTLAELGYDVQWQVVNSKNFGVPQSRERVFIVGNLRGMPRREVFPCSGQSNKNTTIGKSAKTAVARTLTGGGHTGGNHSGMTILCIPVLTPDRAEKRQNGRRFKNDGDPAFTLTSQDRHGVLLQVGTLRTHKDGNGFREIKSGVSPTIPARAREDGSGQPVICGGAYIRRLTPMECERLQGFPDGWTDCVSDTQRYKCLGNAVTVNVTRFILQKIFNS